MLVGAAKVFPDSTFIAALGTFPCRPVHSIIANTKLGFLFRYISPA